MNNNGRKKNILIVTSTLCYGGAETVVLNICTHLDPSQFNVQVCLLLPQRGAVGDIVAEHGIPISSIKRFKGVFKYFSFINLVRFIKENNIDLVHSHTTYSLIDTSLCKLFYKKFKLVHTFHYGNFPNYNKKYSLFIKLLCRIPDMLVPVGYRQQEQIRKIYPVKEQKMKVIWNGVTQHANPNKQLEEKYKNTNKIIIGTICLFTEQKGLTYLLESIKSLKSRTSNFLLLIVGGGPIEQEIHAQSKAEGLDDVVHFLGFHDNAAATVLPIFDIFVQSSLWEAMSMAILEAMACSKPIVATDVGDNKKVVEDGGFIIEPKDVQAMTNKLEKLILDKELRIRLGNQGYERYKKCCSTKEMVRNYENLYQNLTS